MPALGGWGSMMVKRTYLAAASAAVLLAGLPVTAVAAKDQPSVEVRVDKLEHEMRAVQRKIFPGGDGKYFPPEITPPDQPTQPAPGVPAANPVVDLESRVNALEKQVSVLTGQSETGLHRIQLLEDAFSAYKRTTDARLKALEDGATTPGGAGADSIASTPPRAAGTIAAPSSSPRPASASTPPATKPEPAPVRSETAAAKPDPAHAAAVAAVQKPVTTDPADDIYVYGYRLWTAKLYPEAETQLKLVTTKYPDHRRANWALNLLGRTYLDEGKNREAVQAFYDNYKKYPAGERTPDSVYYLAAALKKLNRPTADICKAYGVLTDAYGAKLTPTMAADVAKQRTDLKCP